MNGLNAPVRRLAERAASRYVAGSCLADAVEVAGRIRQPVTWGYWNRGDEPAAVVAAAYQEALTECGLNARDAYISIKLPALEDDAHLLRDVLDAAHAKGVLVHFDSLDEAHAEATVELACQLSAAGSSIGASVPGGWTRSVTDAARLAAAGVRVRIVKGQWPGDQDPTIGFLKIVDAISQRGVPTAIATHDMLLAEEALSRLGNSSPRPELELLYGLPARAGLVAERLDLSTRVYIPYGQGYLPYALRRAVFKPNILWWLAKDALHSGR